MRRVNPRLYTRKYYLTDCSGYSEFKKTWGKKLEPRLERIVKEIPSLQGLKVLDVGCGRGELVFWAAKQGARKVLGIDYSEDAIRLANEAKKHYPKKIQDKVEFRVMDAKNLNFPKESFDIVLLTEVLEHLYLQEQVLVLKKIRKVLKKDGYLFVHTAPSRTFNNITYRFWCYPVSSILVGLSDLITGKRYGNLVEPNMIRNHLDRVMHVNEPDYFSLKKLFSKTGFEGVVKSTNATVAKPINSWKDILFNFFVYLIPASYFPPLNILWGNDFYSVLRKWERLSTT